MFGMLLATMYCWRRSVRRSRSAIAQLRMKPGDARDARRHGHRRGRAGYGGSRWRSSGGLACRSAAYCSRASRLRPSAARAGDHPVYSTTGPTPAAHRPRRAAAALAGCRSRPRSRDRRARRGSEMTKTTPRDRPARRAAGVHRAGGRAALSPRTAGHALVARAGAVPLAGTTSPSGYMPETRRLAETRRVGEHERPQPAARRAGEPRPRHGALMLSAGHLGALRRVTPTRRSTVGPGHPVAPSSADSRRSAGDGRRRRPGHARPRRSWTAGGVTAAIGNGDGARSRVRAARGARRDGRRGPGHVRRHLDRAAARSGRPRAVRRARPIQAAHPHALDARPRASAPSGGTDARRHRPRRPGTRARGGSGVPTTVRAARHGRGACGVRRPRRRSFAARLPTDGVLSSPARSRRAEPDDVPGFGPAHRQRARAGRDARVAARRSRAGLVTAADLTATILGRPRRPPAARGRQACGRDVDGVPAEVERAARCDSSLDATVHALGRRARGRTSSTGSSSPAR